MDKLFVWAKKLGPLFLMMSVMAYAIPRTKKLGKFRNAILASRAFLQGQPLVTTRPVGVRIAPTAICNYRCLFCEIHKDNILYPKRSKNEITLEHIKNYEGVLEDAYNLSFYGGSEEPLVAKEFPQITEYMKKKYGTKLMVNTNASLMKNEVLDSMVENEFDYIIVSYHAGTTDGYRAIMTGKIDKVDANLAALRDKKKATGKKKPVVAFNFALQRLNSDEYEAILQKAKDLAADHVIVNRYYGGRNKLQDQHVSYEYDIEAGNKVLDEIYARGKELGVKIEPAKPEYWEQPAEMVRWDDEDINASIKCQLPWSTLHFNPVLDRANSHFVGVCNRAELFKIDYAKLNLSTPAQADQIWNHSLLQHLRKTVNKGCDSINPLCKFCKNNQREALRNVDAALYAEKRDRAVEAFFAGYQAVYNPAPIDGLEILTENPHSEQKFQEKLTELNSFEIAEKRQLDEALDEAALARIN
jgi:molybdenum cofactor biosynthesis enzyme MoaA